MTFKYSDAHGIAYLLNPRYLGMGMTINKQLSSEELILQQPCSVSNALPTLEKQQSIFEDYTTNFWISVLHMQRSGSIAWTLLQSKRIGPSKFWLSHCDSSYPSLQTMSKQVFSSMVASSAASEQNFSTLGIFIQKQGTIWVDQWLRS